jgi:hypothetical protein
VGVAAGACAAAVTARRATMAATTAKRAIAILCGGVEETRLKLRRRRRSWCVCVCECVMSA